MSKKQNLKTTVQDGQTLIWDRNKQIGFVDENDQLFAIDPLTGYSTQVGPINHSAEIIPKLKKWLSSQH